MRTLVAGVLGLLVGVVIGVLAGAELGRHDDASLAWWMGVEV